MNSLDGIKVLDLSRVLAGPWCTQTLADLGADVIKIERPETGDDTRGWGPPFLQDAQGKDTAEAAYYLGTNRNKRSVACDISTPAGQQTIRDLLLHCDVFVENFKVGDMARYGLDYATLAKIKPSLVYCSITGFGQTGPYKDRAGYDYAVQGIGGLMSVTGERDDLGGGPQKVGVAVADLFTGMYACTAILAALRHAERTGQGQHIDMALLDVATSVMANQALNYLTTGTAPGMMGNAHPNLAPYAVFDCADGWIILATGNDAQYRRLCGVLGLADMAGAAEFATNADRIANRADMTRRLTGATMRWSKADLLAACEAEGVPAGPINDLAEVFSDPQVIARAMQIAPGGVPGVRSPMTFSGAELALDRPAPTLGQDD